MSAKGLLKAWLVIGLTGYLTVSAVLPASAKQSRRQTDASSEQCWIPAGAMDLFESRGYGYWGSCSTPGARRVGQDAVSTNASSSGTKSYAENDGVSRGQCWIPAGAMDLFGARGYGYWGSCSTPGARPTK